MGSELRQELGAPLLPDVPAFRMAVPEGWIAFAATPENERALLQQASKRLMQQHRPDLMAEVQAMTTQSFKRLRSERGFMVVMPGDTTPEELFLPTAIHGSVRAATAQYTLDQVVKGAVARWGARPLDSNKQIAAWRQEGKISVQGEDVSTTTAAYLIPIPGAKRSRALQLVAAFVHPDERDPDDDLIEQWIDLIDAHVATFAWEKP
ncbi:hypothetical protein [uncultured Agrococcus sp.]|uniref:hypothetical protein n=1 Tax=uncultured Agrococcus sp. TaxID=382258 RepID=UPI0025DB7F71|nr:hypothetical protein [uncultured Agrococcus sp.]